MFRLGEWFEVKIYSSLIEQFGFIRVPKVLWMYEANWNYVYIYSSFFIMFVDNKF